MSIPLKFRKLIKEAVAGFEEHLKAASTICGTTLQFVDNTTEIFTAAMATSEEAAEYIKSLPDYGQYMIDAFKSMTEDDLGKEALTNLVTLAGGKVKFIIRDPSVSLTDYWVVDSTGFGIEIRSDSIGYWGGYYSAENLQKLATVATEGAAMPLAQRRNLKELEGEISAAMKKLSAVYGGDLTWDPDYGKLWTWLKENDDQYAGDPGWYNLGKPVRDYVVFLSDTLGEFMSNDDNKEALKDKCTTNKLGFSYLPKGYSEYVNWAWVDGKLCLEVVGGSFACWITTGYYSLEKLEATL